MIKIRWQPRQDDPVEDKARDRLVASQTANAKTSLENCMTPDAWDCQHESPLLMRQGRPDDIDRALDFVRHLSPGTRYFRFGKMQGLSFDRDRLAGIFNPDDDHNVHYIVTISEDSREIMIASGRLVIPEAGSASELLIVVRDDWQGRGVGRRLVAKLCHAAILREVHTVYCQVLPTNQRMQRFMHNCGFKPAINAGHELLLQFEKRI